MIQGNGLYRARRSGWSLHSLLAVPGGHRHRQMNFLSDHRINTVCGVNIKGITVMEWKERRAPLSKVKEVC